MEWGSEAGSQQRMCEGAGGHFGRGGAGEPSEPPGSWRIDFKMVLLRVEEVGLVVHQLLHLIPMTFGSNAQCVRPDQSK